MFLFIYYFTDINDCADQPCSLLFDCVDLKDGFSCELFVWKLLVIGLDLLIILGSFTILLCFLTRKEEDHCWYDIRLCLFVLRLLIYNYWERWNNLNAVICRMYFMFGPYLNTIIFIFQDLHWFNVSCQNKPA